MVPHRLRQLEHQIVHSSSSGLLAHNCRRFGGLVCWQQQRRHLGANEHLAISAAS